MAYIVNNIKWDRIWISFYIDKIYSNSDGNYPSIYIKDTNGSFKAELQHSDDNPS